ncbi:MAG: aspartate/glutamate racemase family protein [Burkholderiales bacterium]
MTHTIGLVTPQSTDRVPAEGAQMYPEVNFIPKGVGVRALTPEGYDSAWEGILPAAEQLAAREGVEAVMVAGTSLTFYRGAEEHARLLEKLKAITGKPVGTMSSAVVEGLQAVGAKRIAVCTAYGDEVNLRLKNFLTDSGFEVLKLEGFGITEFGKPGTKTEQDIIDLAARVHAAAPEAEGMLISCGGLRTLGVAKPIEDREGLPVVASTPACFWSAMRLVGESGRYPGHGRLLEQATH